MQKLTAVIPCKNEAHNIEEVLQSVSWADEILLVDSFSTDNTLALAEKFNPKVIKREYENSASQKNWAIPQAKHEWILLVDADERVTPELRKEIESILNSNEPDCVAYWIGRRNFFLGKEIKHSGWQRDKVIRLFKRDLCRYEEKAVHAEIVADGKVGKLKSRLIHNTYRDMDHYMDKWRKYAAWSAIDASKKVKWPTPYHFLAKPGFRFFKHYFVDLGILDGRAGIVICGLSAMGVFMRYVKLLEYRRFGFPEEPNS